MTATGEITVSFTDWTEADTERLRAAWDRGFVGGSEPVELIYCGDGTAYVLDACGWPVWFCTECDGQGWTRDTIEHFDGCGWPLRHAAEIGPDGRIEWEGCG